MGLYTSEGSNKGGLTRTTGTDKAGDGADFDLDGDAVECLMISAFDVKTMYFDGRIHLLILALFCLKALVMIGLSEVQMRRVGLDRDARYR